jgi:hypothetical protein
MVARVNLGTLDCSRGREFRRSVPDLSPSGAVSAEDGSVSLNGVVT